MTWQLIRSEGTHALVADSPVLLVAYLVAYRRLLLLHRFQTRLSAGNRRHLQTMLLLARSFLKAVDGGGGEDTLFV
jgi:hypothetical protein